MDTKTKQTFFTFITVEDWNMHPTPPFFFHMQTAVLLFFQQWHRKSRPKVWPGINKLNLLLRHNFCFYNQLEFTPSCWLQKQDHPTVFRHRGLKSFGACSDFPNKHSAVKSSDSTGPDTVGGTVTVTVAAELNMSNPAWPDIIYSHVLQKHINPLVDAIADI